MTNDAINDMGKHICVLEDNEGIMDVLRLLFHDENYKVTGYYSVVKMLKDVDKIKADVFLLDVMLPDGNGLEVCNLLKMNLNTKNIPVLMMSAAAGINEVKHSCQAQDFVAKPFDIFELVNRVNHLVACTHLN